MAACGPGLVRSGAAVRAQLRARWFTLGLLGIATIAVIIGMSIRMSETEIELQLTTTSVDFESMSEYRFASLPVTALELSGLDEVVARGPDPRSDLSIVSPDGNFLEVAVALRSQGVGSIQLAGIQLHDRSQVILAAEPDSRLTFDLTNAAQEIAAGLSGPLDVQVSGQNDIPIQPGTQWIVHGRTHSLLRISARMELSRCLACDDAPIREISFERRDQEFGPMTDYIRQGSAIQSGELIMMEVNRDLHRIHNHETVTFEPVDVRLRSIRPADSNNSSFNVELGGVVRRLKLGTSRNPEDMMPRLLEWLLARHSLKLAWLAMIYLFTLGAAVVRWWRPLS
jgi:hypothetical protein